MLRPQTYNEVRAQKLVYCDSCQRVLYFDPSTEVVVEASNAPHRRRRARPKSDAPQAWFYRSDYPEHGEVLLGLENISGTSTRRIYDFNTGRQLGDTLNREGEYPLAFPEDLAGAVRLNGSWSEEEIESWGGEMPMIVLDAFHADLQAAQDTEKQHAAHKEHAQAAAEHPATT
jgi:hypothetical protein